MAQIYAENGDAGPTSDLPELASIGLSQNTAKEKVRLVLRLLRQAAVDRRESKGRPFYSIRTVAKHFSLPPTTVTRLYGQLKTEGVLGSIWGSKTIVEPKEIDNEIRLRALIGLPVSIRSFSVSPGYRKFFWLMQHTLWKHRFGSQLVFYENGFSGTPKFTDILLDYKTDIIIWLTPSSRVSSAIARLKDRGVKSITIADGTPINGDPGYFVSRQNAIVEGLAAWKTAGVRSVVAVREDQSTSSNTHRMLQTALLDAGIPIVYQELDSAGSNESSMALNSRQSGIIFESAQSVLQFANRHPTDLSNLLQQLRVMSLEGAVDLPFETHVSSCFDTIEFDWRAVARRVVSDLVAKRGAFGVHQQAIFKAKWRSAPQGP